MQNLLFRIIRRFILFFNKMYNEMLFRQVNCNIQSIIIGPDCNSNFFIVCPNQLNIGDGTVINGYCYLQAYGGISIGKYCHIGKGLTIYSHNHNYNSTKSIPYDDNDIMGPVFIGDFVWVGANVTILPGVKVGEGVVIGAGCVVTKDVPDYAIIGGNPHKILKYRNIEVFQQLKAAGQWV